ncbi:MAG: T9SS type A sorting domain-containing protein, partial [Marinilabiliaceae bacterium]|nr:T9SS type A sorting domain-containing protein [Marinilabiliaceae bacterium]
KFANGEAHISVSPDNWQHTITWPDATSETSWLNLSGGDFKVEVKDPFGCKDERHFTIFEPDTLNLVINQLQSPLCYGNSNGIIDSRMAGGVSPYRINWNIGSESELLTKLDTGLYKVEILDANDCFFEQAFDLGYRRFSAPYIGPDTLICHYDKLQLDAGDYSKFRWSANGNFSSKRQQVTLTDPDTYYLEVSDADNCLGYDTLKLEVSYLQIDDLQIKDVTCYGFSDGVATITVSPAEWPHKVTWPDGSQLNSWSKLSGGTYEVNIADRFGCGDKDYFKIDEPAPLAINMNKQLDPYCFGVPDGIIETEGNGGVANYRYNWLHGENNRKIEKLDTGRYVLDLFDGNNCHIREAFNMQYVKTIYPQLGNDLVICQGNNTKLYPGEYKNYQWFKDDVQTSSDTALIISNAGNYRVQVSDDFGCIGRDTMSLELRATDLVPEFLTATSVPAGDTLIIVEVSQPKPNKIEWFFTGEHQVVETGAYYCKVIFTEEGIREVSLNAHSYNCFAQARKTILVTPAGSGEDADNPAEQGYTNLMKVAASPNPSNGYFNVDVELSETAPINIYLVSLGSGKILDQRKGSGMKLYNASFNLSIPGPYVVIVESGGERRVTKMIIK